MIFITLGSQKFQFNRLLQAVDELIVRKVITDRVFAQTGYSDYTPKHYEFKAFLSHTDFDKAEEKADIIITHGGTGAVINAVKKGKKVIAVPRLAKYGEHVDDHQLQVIQQLAHMNIICACIDCPKLDQALRTVQITEYAPYQSNTQALLNSISHFLTDYFDSKYKADS